MIRLYKITNKNSRPQNGTGVAFASRGTTQISRVTIAGLFVLTIISLSCNVENTAQTTKRDTWTPRQAAAVAPDTLFTFTAQEGTSTGFG